MKKRSTFVLLLTALVIGSAVPAAAAPYCGGRGPGCGRNYVDANGDGICDNFVDNNGDGINDDRPGYGRGQGRGSGRGYGQCRAVVTSPAQNTASKKAVAAKTVTKKETIKKIQRRLNKIGYRCGKVNGIMNVKTKNALKSFKRTKGLKVNNAINKQTLKALGIS